MNNIQKYLWCYIILIICRKVEHSVVNEESDTSDNKSNESATDTVDILCSSEKLVVKGNNVHISVVLNATCVDEVHIIEVFALNYLFIDADIDKTGQQIHLSLIAPTWEVIGERKFILDGEAGGEYYPPYAPDGIGSFRHGKPGDPGGSAGQLLGVGNEFINARNLTISMNGGIGGSGQHGGKGSNGVNGTDPPVPDNSTVASSLFESLQFRFKELTNQTESNKDSGIKNTFITFRVYGRNGTKPGNGGNGGVGGIGGHAGIYVVVGIQEDPAFSVVDEAGDNGAPGEGGFSGNEARNGFTLDILYQDQYNMTTDDPLDVGGPSPSINEMIIIIAENGIDGINDIRVRYPDDVELINPANVINDYKSFLREHLGDDSKNSKLKQFLEDLDKNVRIQSLYDTFGLVNDVQGLELQYFQLKNKVSVEPFIESLLNRTAEYAKSITEPDENKEVLRWLYSVLTMKLNILTKSTQIINLPEYIEELQTHISKFRHYQYEVRINDQQNHYKHFLNSEIQSVIEHINFQIMPKIEDNLVDVSSQVGNLIDELYERQYKFINKTVSLPDDIEKYLPNVTDTIMMMMPHDKMSPFKIISSVLGALTSMSVGKIMMIEKGNEQIKDWLGDSPYVPSSLNFNKLEIDNQIREKYQLLLEQLCDIERELNNFLSEGSSNNLQDITQKVRQLKFWLINNLQNSHTFDSNDIDQKHNELITFLEGKQSELQPSDGLSSILEITLAILNLREIPIDVYKQMSREKIIKLLNFNELNKEMEEEARTFNSTIENIYDVILQRFEDMETKVNEISWNLIDKSHFELKINRWHVNSAIRDTKAFYRKLGNETAVKETLYRSIEKLEDCVNALIDVHDHIDLLTKGQSINAFVDVISGKPKYSQYSKLNDAVVNLKKIIQMNVVLDMYELMLNAFKKHYFPFAQAFISELQFPRDLQPCDTDELVKMVINNIHVLEDKMRILDASIGSYDQLLFNNVEFSSSETSFVGPFYTWTNSAINMLLMGDEVILTANISTAAILNAVKFNEIGIRFIARDADTQKNLDRRLENVMVSMTMMAENYYRCDADIYSFTVDDNISLNLSYKRHPNGTPIIMNDVYRKLIGNDNFLSPYTTWKFQLTNVKKYDFSQFSDDTINLELFGRGQYILNTNMTSEICKEYKIHEADVINKK